MRLLGVEDGSFKAHLRDVDQLTILCGVVWTQEGIEDIQLREVTVDGLDVTERLLDLMKGMQLDAVILGGVTFAGFNVMDVHRLHRETDVPIIIYIAMKPNQDRVKKALEAHFDDWEKRYSMIDALGPIHEAKTHEDDPPIFFEVVGCDAFWAENVLKESAVLARTPEPVRIAGFIARGLTLR